MTKERQALIDRFQKWLDTKPREQIIAAQCANIAEDYAEQLRLHNVVGRSEQQIKAMIIMNIIDNCTIELDNTGQERYSLNEEQFGKCVDALVEKLTIPVVVGRSEQLPQIHGLIKCECGKVYDVDVENNYPSCGN